MSVSAERCSSGCVLVQLGPGTHIGPSGTDGAKVRGHIGRAAARGERAAVRGGKNGGGIMRASCNVRGQTWAVAHMRFVFCTWRRQRGSEQRPLAGAKCLFSHFVFNGFEFLPWAMR